MSAEREPFELYFFRAIAPGLEAQENARRNAVRTFVFGSAAGLATAAVVLVAERADGDLSPLAQFIAIVLAVAGFAIGGAMLAAVGHRVKTVLVPKVAEYAGANYRHKGGDTSIVRDFFIHKLVPAYDRSSFEDFFSGDRAGCPFELFEAHLQERHTDSKGRTRTVTVFRGQLLRVLFPRDFLGRTIVLRDAGLFNAFIKPGPDLKRVGLVDPKFEKIFEVFSTDQVEARYLLTPDFMERLLELEDIVKGKKARAAFADGELLVAIEGGNLFEAGSMFTTLVDPGRAARVLKEIDTVGAVIDALVAARGAASDASAG